MRPKAGQIYSTIHPIGSPVDGAVEIVWIDESLEQPQGVAEAYPPILRQAPLAQREDARGEVQNLLPGQNQGPSIVGNQVQAVVPMAEIPADSAVTGRTLPDRRREAQQAQPLAAPGGHILRWKTGLNSTATVPAQRDHVDGLCGIDRPSGDEQAQGEEVTDTLDPARCTPAFAGASARAK